MCERNAYVLCNQVLLCLLYLFCSKQYCYNHQRILLKSDFDEEPNMHNKVFTKHEIDKSILEVSKQFSIYENHRKTLQTMIIFEAHYMRAKIAFFTSCCSFHVTEAAFRLSTLWYYPMLISIIPNVR